jgi:peptidoglycan-associated lipoprotein
MDRHRIALSVRLGLAVLALLLLLACASKNEPTGPEGAQAAGSPGGGATSPWTPEASTPTLQVESSADAYNKQGVLKRIHFETNKWDIQPDDRRILKENAAWLLAHPQFNVTVEGHCDERNTEAYNLALGERRANAAKEYLVGLGIAGNKIQTVSYGKARPLCTQHDESCWTQNRRDEFMLQEAK